MPSQQLVSAVCSGYTQLTCLRRSELIRSKKVTVPLPNSPPTCPVIVRHAALKSLKIATVYHVIIATNGIT